MDWYRRYHGTCADPKFRLVARSAGVPTPFAICAWDAVLEHASSHTDRGSAEGMNAELMAITVDISEEQAQSLLDQFAKRGMIVGDRVAAWERRQRNSDSSAERVRKHRERQKEAAETATETDGNGGGNVTDHDGNVTVPENVTLPTRGGARQSRTDQNQTLTSFESERAPRATRLPADYPLTDQHRAIAREEGFTDAEAERVFASFVDYWHAASGSNARKCDWLAAWRGWVRREADRRGSRNGLAGQVNGGSVGCGASRQAGRPAVAAQVVLNRRSRAHSDLG